jgi:hypothetical protein
VNPLARYLWKRYLAAVARNRSKLFVRLAAALMDMGYETYATATDETGQRAMERIFPLPQGKLVCERILKFPYGNRSVEKLFRLDA